MTSHAHRFRVLSLAILLGGAAADRCRAQTTIWTESGDAGQTLSTYQKVVGTGSLTAITGSISGANDVDIFSIYIADPSTFSATTATNAGSLNDTQLFLFKLDGTGILANDDSGGTLKSTLPAGDSRLTGLIAGTYLIGISAFDLDAYDSANQIIFQSSPYTDVFGPNPGVGPLDHWSSSESTGSYTITLTGANFVSAVPEPVTTTLMLGSGCAVVALLFRRRNRRGAVDVGR
jgi:hypothetical protein